MVVGAHQETDQDVLVMADRHYKEFKLKRVYFSGYIPINTENTICLLSVQHHLCCVKIVFIKVIG